MTEVKNILRIKNPVSRPSSVKVALLIEGSSVVIQVVLEDSPSPVLFISLLFSLILEMLISVSPELANIFKRSSSLALKILTDFKFTLQLLSRDPFICWLTNISLSLYLLYSLWCKFILLSIWHFHCTMNILATFNFIVPTQTTTGFRNICFHNFVFVGIFGAWIWSYVIYTTNIVMEY